jgi:hypothetical protein
MDFTCDLANIFRKKKTNPREPYFFEPFDAPSKQAMFDDLKLLTRETTAHLVSELYDEKEDEDVVINLICACHDAEALLNLYVDCLQRNSVENIDILEVLPEIKPTYTFIDNIPCETYFFNSLKHMMYYDVFNAFHLFTTSECVRVKRCENPECRRYFTVKGRSDKIYCDYPAPQNPKLECNDSQLTRFYGYSELEVKAKRLAHAIYVSIQRNYKKKHKTGPNYSLEHFTRRNDEFKESVKTGKRTLEDYYEWLQNCKFD